MNSEPPPTSQTVFLLAEKGLLVRDRVGLGSKVWTGPQTPTWYPLHSSADLGMSPLPFPVLHCQPQAECGMELRQVWLSLQGSHLPAINH